MLRILDVVLVNLNECVCSGECDGDGVPDELLPRNPAEGAAGGQAGPGRGQNTGLLTHICTRAHVWNYVVITKSTKQEEQVHL